MTNDGKIYITISDKRFGRNKAEADEQNKIDKQKEENKNNPLQDYAVHQFYNLVKNKTMQAVNYTINNIGNFTGDYSRQIHVQDEMKLLSDLTGLGFAMMAGAKYGGGLGLLIGAGAYVGGYALTTALEFNAGQFQTDKTNRQIAQLRTRAGLNSSNNGSRGTEY